MKHGISTRTISDVRSLGRLLAVGLVLTILAMPVGADQTLPSADSLINDYIEATGGRAAHEKVTSRVVKGTLEFTGQGMKLDMTAYSAAPNLHYMLMESETLGKIEQGSDGEVAWESSMMAGPRIKEGEERHVTLREARFDKYLEWKKIFQSAECVGAESVQDKMSYKVVLTPKTGKPQTIFFDRDSHLIVRLDVTMESQVGTLTIVSYPSDYRDVGGVLQPHKITVEVAGQKRVMTVHSMEQNVDLPKDRFALPDEIKALAAKAKKPE